MNYNGIELKEVTEPQIFDPPKKMLVWNNTMDYAASSMIAAIVERMDGLCAMCYDGESYPHCAEIPEEPKPRMVTNRELSKWLAQGNGEWGISKFGVIEKAEIGWFYDTGYEKQTLQSELRVRKWEDTDWHAPTADYLGLE